MQSTNETPALEPERLSAVLDGRDDPGCTEQERLGYADYGDTDDPDKERDHG